MQSSSRSSITLKPLYKTTLKTSSEQTGFDQIPSHLTHMLHKWKRILSTQITAIKRWSQKVIDVHLTMWSQLQPTAVSCPRLFGEHLCNSLFWFPEPQLHWLVCSHQSAAVYDKCCHTLQPDTINHLIVLSTQTGLGFLGSALCSLVTWEGFIYQAPN